MKHGSLFSGIGGFDLAAEWMGWENVFHCEWMEFPRKVLDYYWPDADSHVDICKTDFTKYANTIDILTGGFPCQPFSLAGKRKGTDDERYLWHEMLRAIREIKPKWVIAENVFGIVNIDSGMVFEQVCLDLEAEGYEVQPFIIPAVAKNAPHRRDRCWFVAYSSSNRKAQNRCSITDERRTKAPLLSQNKRWESQTIQSIRLRSIYRNATNPDSIGYRGWNKQSESNIKKERKICKNEQQHRDGIRCEIERCSWFATNSDSNGQHECNSKYEINASERGINALSNIEQRIVDGDATDTDSRGLERSIEVGRNGNNVERKSQFGDATDTESVCIQGQCDGQRKGQFRRGDWCRFPTQSPVCSGDDGLPTKLDGITFPKWRNESIKGYGNAIVPQIALQLFQIIEHESKNQNT